MKEANRALEEKVETLTYNSYVIAKIVKNHLRFSSEYTINDGENSRWAETKIKAMVLFMNENTKNVRKGIKISDKRTSW